MHKAPLIVAGVIFALVALLHLCRLYFQFPIIINTYSVPYWANGVAFVITALLSYWMFYAASKD